MALAKSSPDPWMIEAFEAAQADFNSNLRDADKYDFSQYRSVEEVYKATDAIQRKQSKAGNLQHLSRIQPYLECLGQFEGVIEVFVQVKPDILALIWGPIKFMLQIAAGLANAFSQVIEILELIGRSLPHFKRFSQLFESNGRIQKLLCLFYQDILDVHVTLLNLFAKSKGELFVESLWPKTIGKINIIRSRIAHHQSMMAEEVTLENISQEVSKRQRDYQQYEQAQEFQELQNFRNLLAEISPRLYIEELKATTKELTPGSGNWLEENADFRKWADPSNLSRRCLWLQGIPGAGKTSLAGTVISHLQSKGRSVLFAFLTYKNEKQSSLLKLFQSLMFQALFENQAMRPVLHAASLSNYRELIGDGDFVKELLFSMLQDSGLVYVVVDGLDEAPEDEKPYLLGSILGFLRSCKSVKVLISCRAESTITRELTRVATPLRVDQLNGSDITAYVERQGEIVVSRFRGWGADATACNSVRAALAGVGQKAKGMFLYAKLIISVVNTLDNPQEIQEEVENLPDGLDQAYGRILVKIEKKLSGRERAAARKILEWIATAKRPLRQEEILQGLAIQPGVSGFSKGRKVFRDIQQACGPIIEVRGQHVVFVHFTAKQYLFSGEAHFLQQLDAEMGVTSVCLTYLAFDCLDPLFGEGAIGELEQQLLSGDFVLVEYAASQWLDHLRHCAEFLRSSETDNLTALLKTFFLKRQRSRGRFSDHDLPKSELRRVFRRMPELAKQLARSEKFELVLKSGALDQEVDDGDGDWVEADPTRLSVATLRLRAELENCLCNTLRHKPNCHCSKLEELYGEDLFKCKHVSCPHFARGFATRSARSDHMKIHTRPHKCTDLECFFAKLGFRSASDLTDHEKKCHVQHATAIGNWTATSGQSRIAENNLTAVILDAIEQDQVDVIEDILSSDASARSTDYHWLFTEALAKGSPSVIRCMLKAGKARRSRSHSYLLQHYSWGNGLASAIVADNVTAVEILMTQNVDLAAELLIPGEPAWPCDKRDLYDDYGIAKRLSPFELAFGQANDEIIGILLQHGAPRSIRSENLRLVFAGSGQRLLLTKDNAETRARLKKLEMFRFPSHVYQYGLAIATKLSSVPYARYCLRKGANANGTEARSRRSSLMPVPLLEKAAKSGHGEMVKLLLQHGASPEAARNCRDSAGVGTIEKYFSMTWEDIVEKYRLIGKRESWQRSWTGSRLAEIAMPSTDDTAGLATPSRADPGLADERSVIR